MWSEKPGITNVLFNTQTNKRCKMHNVMNKNIAEKTLINNNTLAGYLHSKGMVQYFHLDLLGNTHLFQPPR